MGIAVIDLITDNLEAIQQLCRTFGVRRLDVFGSAVSDAFDPKTSDVDFIVDLGEYTPGTADRYLDLADALEALLGRPVDLVTEPSIRNPYFRQSVDAQRANVYEARDSQAAA